MVFELIRARRACADIRTGNIIKYMRRRRRRRRRRRKNGEQIKMAIRLKGCNYGQRDATMRHTFRFCEFIGALSVRSTHKYTHTHSQQNSMPLCDDCVSGATTNETTIYHHSLGVYKFMSWHIARAAYTKPKLNNAVAEYE